MIQPIVNMFDANQSYEQTIKELKENGFTTLFMIGVTPFPFQVGVVAAGAAGFSVILFTIAVTFSRAIRFVLIAIFVMIIGSRAEDLLRKYELELMIGGVLLFIGSAIYLFFF
jgi:membrane protein YqaA with SNARE-associated domain